MGAPTTSMQDSRGPDPAGPDPAGTDGPPRTPEGPDPLAEIATVLAALKQQDEDSAETAAHVLEDRQAFVDGFRALCAAEIRPAMEAVLDRLRQAGGDGLVEEHPGGEPRVATPRLTLWMSLQGPVGDPPRQDRNPYLQLDADVAGRVIRLSEGDSWRGSGAGYSGSAGTWKLADVTQASVVQELLGIVRRSARIAPS